MGSCFLSINSHPMLTCPQSSLGFLFNQVDLATEWERQLTMGKRAKRTAGDFLSPICRSAIGQASCLICASLRQLRG